MIFHHFSTKPLHGEFHGASGRRIVTRLNPSIFGKRFPIFPDHIQDHTEAVRVDIRAGAKRIILFFHEFGCHVPKRSDGSTTAVGGFFGVVFVFVFLVPMELILSIIIILNAQMRPQKRAWGGEVGKAPETFFFVDKNGLTNSEIGNLADPVPV